MELPVYLARRCPATLSTEVRERALARRVFALVLVSALVVGCGGHQRKARDDHGTETQRTAPVVTGPGRLVNIGGGRSLYLKCVGSGTPTVVLEAGFGDNTDTWSEVQPQLSETTRTCAYDRAGLGNSLPIPGVHDAGDEIQDLRQLLGHAHVGPPYVLVGHSYGGMLARLFANAHPAETAGVVLIEATSAQARRSTPRSPRSATRRWRSSPAPETTPATRCLGSCAGGWIGCGRQCRTSWHCSPAITCTSPLCPAVTTCSARSTGSPTSSLAPCAPSCTPPVPARNSRHVRASSAARAFAVAARRGARRAVVADPTAGSRPAPPSAHLAFSLMGGSRQVSFGLWAGLGARGVGGVLISLSALGSAQSVRGSCLGFSIPCGAVRRPESSGSLPRQDGAAAARRH
jgi:pimeloyl-ACP methyl ester carboxylesterase